MSVSSVRIEGDTQLRGLAELQRRLDAARSKVVKVGVPSGPVEENGTSLGYVAAIQEFGGFVAPHSRVNRQTLRFNPRTGRLIGAASSEIVERAPAPGASGPIQQKIRNRNINAILVRAKHATFENGITIPARPWLRPGIWNNLARSRSIARKALAQVARGAMEAVTALELLGTDAAGAVKRYFITGEFQANAPSTIRKKKSSRPLIDSSQLRQSVTHVVEAT
jgi:hypothetical protein